MDRAAAPNAPRPTAAPRRTPALPRKAPPSAAHPRRRSGPGGPPARPPEQAAETAPRKRPPPAPRAGPAPAKTAAAAPAAPAVQPRPHSAPAAQSAPPRKRPPSSAPTSPRRAAVRSPAPAPRRTLAMGPLCALSTDAPAHWPRTRAPEHFLRRSDPQFREALVSGVRTSLQGAGLKPEEGGMRWLTADGVLEAHIVVRDGGQDVPVFVYPRADGRAAAHYAGAQRLLAALRGPAPVHYAVAPLPKAPAANPCIPLEPRMLAPATEAEEAAGTYAMWWATPEEPRFDGSRVQEAARRLYVALDGREGHAVKRILTDAGLPRLAQKGLPDEDGRLCVALRGPDGVVVQFTASARKGLRFHFHKGRTPPAYRDRFWTHFASYAEALADRLMDAEAGKQSYYEERPMRWLESVERRMRGASGPEAIVGGILLE